ncbi:MAG: MgtC/SapB family protein, partial [Candidatus Nanohaloarchaea archaeon]|nr:MgtC/SapB family protein [Candidatus Nanohaloarchaea archaeon]
MPPVEMLQQVVLAFALGALVGLERERTPGEKYAGLRTLSLLCGAGPVAVFISSLSGSPLPVAIYLALGGVFSLLVLYIRVEMEQQELGLTTSSSVFLMALVGVLVGYAQYFSAVAVTLIGVFLLTEKHTFDRYMQMLDQDEISDAVGLGILALVLYPVLPQGAVDPYGVLFLRK